MRLSLWVTLWYKYKQKISQLPFQQAFWFLILRSAFSLVFLFNFQLNTSKAASIKRESFNLYWKHSSVSRNCHHRHVDIIASNIYRKSSIRSASFQSFLTLSFCLHRRREWEESRRKIAIFMREWKKIFLDKQCVLMATSFSNKRAFKKVGLRIVCNIFFLASLKLISSKFLFHATHIIFLKKFKRKTD